MGLNDILRVLRRHMIVSTLVLGITLAAAAAFYVLTPTRYEASSTFVLFPGSEPTDQLFESHPEYAKRNSDNPYLNGGDVSTATAVLVQTMQSDDVRNQLVEAGADREYVVAIDNSVLSGGQMISITGTGTSAAMAEHTAEIVGVRLPKLLTAMQTVNGAQTPYLVTARETLSPDQAVAKTSGKLRSVVVIVVGGFAVLFGALTVLEAMAAARAERAASGNVRRRRTGHTRTDRTDPEQPATEPPAATTQAPVYAPAPEPIPVAQTVTPAPTAAPAQTVAADNGSAEPAPAMPAPTFGATRRVAVSRSVRARAGAHPVTANGHRRPTQ